MSFKKRQRLIANVSCSTKLFTDDLREIARLSDLEKRTASDLLRELVHEALRARRLRAAGRDEAADFYRGLYRDLLQEGLQPLLTQLGQMQAWWEAALPMITTTPGDLAEVERQRQETRRQRVHFALSAQMLRHVLAAENFGRVLTTIGMQRDQIGEMEVQAQLSAFDAAAHRNTQAILKKMLADDRLTTASAEADKCQNEDL